MWQEKGPKLRIFSRDTDVHAHFTHAWLVNASPSAPPGDCWTLLYLNLLQWWSKMVELKKAHLYFLNNKKMKSWINVEEQKLFFLKKTTPLPQKPQNNTQLLCYSESGEKCWCKHSIDIRLGGKTLKKAFNLSIWDPWRVKGCWAVTNTMVGMRKSCWHSDGEVHWDIRPIRSFAASRFLDMAVWV